MNETLHNLCITIFLSLQSENFNYHIIRLLFGTQCCAL